jgi:hypothetical protein
LSPGLLEAFGWAVEALEDIGVTHAAIGGVARNAWGSTRTTTDLDFELALGPDRLQALVDRMSSSGIHLARKHGPADPADLVPDLIVMRAGDPVVGVRVDLLITKTAFQEGALARRRKVQVLGKSAWVVSPEDLVVYKLVAYRGRDQDDIEDVLRTRLAAGDAVDWGHVDRWAAEWGVEDRWSSLRARLHPGT